MTIEGKDADVVAIYEKWVADYPNFADAHAMLAGAHESLGRAALRSRAPDAANTSTAQFEIVAVHLRRAVDLTASSDAMTYDPIRSLIDIYGPLGLNRPAEYERLVGEGLKRHPADPLAHAYVIAVLARKGDPIDGAARAARAAMPKTAHARTELAAVLMAFARDDGETVAVALAAAALGLVDDALKLNPNDIDALEQKAEILRTQARRVSEPERAKLLVEEARLRAQAAELHHRRPRPDR
jgi:hypothetical protein